MSGAMPIPGPTHYSKPWLSCPQQVDLLVSRGLQVADKSATAEFLAHVNYYRFSGYCLAFEQTRHQFLDGITFEQVRDAYEFDRVLRDLVTEALEVIEVDLRATVAYYFGQRYGPFGHVDRARFFRTFDHPTWMAKLRDETQRSSEPFVEHCRTRYSEYPNLPVWIAAEVMSFGGLSKMYSGMVRHDQQAIAKRYGLQGLTLRACMHHLVYIRNLCAHHSRLWDRVWAIKPELPYGPRWEPPNLLGNDRLFATLLLLFWLMNHCACIVPFARQWRDRVPCKTKASHTFIADGSDRGTLA